MERIDGLDSGNFDDDSILQSRQGQALYLVLTTFSIKCFLSVLVVHELKSTYCKRPLNGATWTVSGFSESIVVQTPL